MKRRHRTILEALKDLGGKATTREVALSTGLNVNGVSQTLGRLENVRRLGGRAGEITWALTEPEKQTA